MFKSILKIKKGSEVLQALLNLSCGLLFVLPMYDTYFTTENTSSWEPVYLIGDVGFMLMIIPFFIGWFSLQYIENEKLKSILKIIVLLLVTFYFFYGFALLTFPIMDFIPRIGLLLLLIFLPLYIIMFVLERIEKRKISDDEIDHILDA